MSNQCNRPNCERMVRPGFKKCAECLKVFAQRNRKHRTKQVRELSALRAFAHQRATKDKVKLPAVTGYIRGRWNGKRVKWIRVGYDTLEKVLAASGDGDIIGVGTTQIGKVETADGILYFVEGVSRKVIRRVVSGDTK